MRNGSLILVPPQKPPNLTQSSSTTPPLTQQYSTSTSTSTANTQLIFHQTMASAFTIDKGITSSRINFNSSPPLHHTLSSLQNHVPKSSLGFCNREKNQFLAEMEVAPAKSLHALVPKCSFGLSNGGKIQFFGGMEVAPSRSLHVVVPKCSFGWSNGGKKQFLGEMEVPLVKLVQTNVLKCSVGWSNGEKKRFLGETGKRVQILVPKCSVGWSNGEKKQSRGEVEVGAVTTGTPSVVESPLLSMGMREVKDIGEEKIGVLLLNLGGPETLDDVQPFLFNLFADPDIIRLPRLFQFLQKPLAQFISVARAPKSKEGYASIGGGSPLRRITDDQAEELRKALCAKDVPAKVYVGMRYWHPFTEEAIDQIKRDGISKLVVLPLYPQFSISTSGSSLRLLEGIFREDEYLVNMQHTVIPSWYQREGYIKAMANLIQKELTKFDIPEKVMIFFSAHGVPLAYVEEAGDPYKAEMEECVDLIMEELEKRRVNNSYTLAYQSRVGPVEWLKPYTDDTIIELGQKGVKRLLAVPISFVSEHIETLEEIDVEYKELALESGIEKWGRVPALGCEPTFIADLADAVIESLPYVGAMAVSNLEARQSLVPLGSVEELLAVYDSKRKELPPPVTVWEWGWTKSAETWNGRVAMLAVLALLVFEAATGEGLLHQLGILPLSN